MKKIISAFLFLITLIFFSSCRNKTIQLLTKKWDCVQVDNIVQPNAKMLSSKDSADAEQIKAVLLSLNWTFKSRMKYECALNETVTVQGKYELLENDKIMICTSESKNAVNRYIIKSLTENELILSGNAENANLVLHFKPH